MPGDDDKRVLIVEDDEDIAETLAEALADVGYATQTAPNGAEALAMLRAAETSPCLILLDMMMPVMDGREFRERQRQDPRLNAIPVIVLTANAGAAGLAPEMDVARFMKKPVRLDDLLQAVTEVCPL